MTLLWSVLERIFGETSIADVSIPTVSLVDIREHGKVEHETDAIVRTFLYQHARGFTQNEFAQRLTTRTALLTAFGLDALPTQQALSDIWRKFSGDTRRIITAAGIGIRQVTRDHEIIAALADSTVVIVFTLIAVGTEGINTARKRIDAPVDALMTI